MLLRSPRIIPETLTGTVTAARDGVLNNHGLVWLLDGERVRQVIPDAARSVGWTDERPFVNFLSPHLSPKLRVLELGCGDGRVSRHVAPAVGELTCTDVSATMLREARANLEAFGNVRFMRTQGFTLEGFSTGEFDLVFGRGVFAALDMNPALAMLDECARVLRPGGRFAADFYTVDPPGAMQHQVKAVREAARRRRFTAGEMRPYSEAQVRTLCEGVGLEELAVAYGASVAHYGRPPYMVLAGKEDDPVSGNGQLAPGLVSRLASTA
jgi:SAM-dependent methyltransferase